MAKFLVIYKWNDQLVFEGDAYGKDVFDVADRWEKKFTDTKVINVISHPVKDGFWKWLIYGIFCS